MLCPECGEENNRIVDTKSAKAENITVRVRKCLCCAFSWTTEEKVKTEFRKRK